MTRAPLLADAVLRDALLPEAGALPPPGLLDAIAEEIRATRQDRKPLLPALSWPGAGVRRGPRARSWAGHPHRRLVLVLAAVALLLALLGGALLGAGALGPPWAPLRPTGVTPIGTGRALVDRVVTDDRGMVWAVAYGELTRLDPVSGEHRTWTVADDPAFATTAVAAARGGGVWVVEGDVARRFDGEGWAAALRLPVADGIELADAGGGVLWLATGGHGLWRWSEGGWEAEPPGRPTAAAGVLLALGPDEVWVANPGPGVAGLEGPQALGVSHLVDGAWRTYGTADATTFRRQVGAIEQAADGVVWVTTDPGTGGGDPGVARFDGTAWSMLDGPTDAAWWLDAAADGSMWAVTARADGSGSVARWADGAWREFGPADGIASASLGHPAATAAGVYVGTGDGLLRFEDGRWSPALAVEPGPTWVAPEHLVAVSSDEVWAAAEGGLWHWADGSWTGPVLPPDQPGATITALAAGPGGSLWVGTDAGVSRLHDGAWTLAAAGAVRSLAVASDGTLWAGGEFPELVAIRPRGDGFVAHTEPCPVRPWRMAVAADGSVYLGDIGYITGNPGLARFDGRSCSWVDPPGDARRPEVTSILPDPRGGVIVEALSALGDGGGTAGWHRRLLRVLGTETAVVYDAGTVTGTAGLAHVDAAGGIWGHNGAGELDRFDGRRWTTILPGVPAYGSLALAPDGTAFVGTVAGIVRWRPGEALLAPAPTPGR